MSGSETWGLLQAASLALIAGLLAYGFTQRRLLAGARDRTEALAASLRASGAELAGLRATLEVLPDGMLVTDREGRVLGWNTRFAALTGLPAEVPREDVTLESILRAQAEAGEFGLADVDQEVARQAAMLRASAGRSTERQRPDGTTVELVATLLPTGGLAIACRDITARRAAEALREEARRAAEAATAAPSRPRAPVPERPAMPDPLPVSLVRPRRCHVLLVEDLPVNQIVTATQLRREGHRVDVASSGAEALGMLAIRPYDIVLMDLMMPGMSGYEAARRVRGLQGPARQVAIHALTANTGEEDRARCLEAGMQGMVSKPVPPGVLSRLLQQGGTSVVAEAPVTEVAPAAPSALLNQARLADLQRDLPPATLATLCSQCVADMRARVDDLRAAAEKGSADELEAHAHALAGMAASYGMAGMERQMRALMSQAREGDMKSVRAAAAAAGDAMEQGAAALLTWANAA